MRSGRLLLVRKLDEDSDVATQRMNVSVGFIRHSSAIPLSSLAIYRGMDTATYLPDTSAIRNEVVQLVSEGVLLTSIPRRYVARLPFPPIVVIDYWRGLHGSFDEGIKVALTQAARVRFEEALSAAHEHREDPKALKVYTDLLMKHAEQADPNTFKAIAEPAVQQATVINIVTGVPEMEVITDG